MTKDCRQAFETWIKGRVRTEDVIDDKLNLNERIFAAWEGFQAGRASIPAPEVTEEMVKGACKAYHAAELAWRKQQGISGVKGPHPEFMKIALTAALKGTV